MRRSRSKSITLTNKTDYQIDRNNKKNDNRKRKKKKEKIKRKKKIVETTTSFYPPTASQRNIHIDNKKSPNHHCELLFPNLTLETTNPTTTRDRNKPGGETIFQEKDCVCVREKREKEERGRVRQ